MSCTGLRTMALSRERESTLKSSDILWDFLPRGVGELAGVSRQTICNLENLEKRIEKTTVYGILFVMYDILRDGGFDDDENSARYYLPYEILIGMIFDGYAFQSEEDKVKFYLELKSLAYLYYHSDGSVTAVTCRDRLRQLFDEMLLIQQKEEFCLSY